MCVCFNNLKICNCYLLINLNNNLNKTSTMLQLHLSILSFLLQVISDLTAKDNAKKQRKERNEDKVRNSRVIKYSFKYNYSLNCKAVLAIFYSR